MHARTLGRLIPLLLLFLSGCAAIPGAVRELGDPDVVVELADTPFYPQQRFQCGPAALTTSLVASGAEVSLDEISRKLYLPGRRGSLQSEMLAATRTSGRMPYPIDGRLSAIEAELAAGRPVVVLQNLGIAAIPRWHYAVVVGIDGEDGRVILRSGTDRRRVTPIDVFLRTWARGDFWGFTVLRPGEMPANADRHRYFDAAAGLEQAGMHSGAARAWKAALARWPGNHVALFGLANTRFATNELAAAESLYKELLQAAPGLTVARNNLALVLAKRGRLDEALDEIDRAIAGNVDAGLIVELRDTHARIVDMREKPVWSEANHHIMRR